MKMNLHLFGILSAVCMLAFIYYAWFCENTDKMIEVGFLTTFNLITYYHYMGKEEEK